MMLLTNRRTLRLLVLILLFFLAGALCISLASTALSLSIHPLGEKPSGFPISLHERAA